MAMTGREKSLLDSVAVWASYYRSNPHRFAEEYLGLKLKLFQKLLIWLMNFENFFAFIAARGIGKTFISAVFCCVRCILYPGTKICIASGTRNQSINVLEKIQNELIPSSERLRSEISKIAFNNTMAYIQFKNTSIIKVVTASDSARGNRANILILDEFRMIDKETIDTVLKKFLTSPRMPGYIHLPEYAHLKERNKEIYLSSAYFKSHWSFDKIEDFAHNMLDPAKRYISCGFPYQLSIKEGLLERESVEDEMGEAGFSEIQWSIKFLCSLNPLNRKGVLSAIKQMQEMVSNDSANRGKVYNPILC